MPSKPKMQPQKATRKSGGGARSKQERIDDAIMNTNDSSIVSKRSVCKLYMPDEPDFYEPFTTKFIRRNPLINRGYWLRMHAIEQVVRRFLEEENGRSKVVVNLGCGYDPLPFQFWHRHPSLSQNATFVDVDYPQLIARKRDRILGNELLRNALFGTNLRPSQAPVYIRSNRYLALGCDLRDLETLERLLRTEVDATNASFLFLAEVSVTYMPTPDADSVIRWASTLGDARFCLLEQFLPQGSEHPFAQTMLRHFDKLHSPIHAVQQYPLLNQQVSRFVDAGWSHVEIARNLWDLWSDDGFTSANLRRGLDTIEPFDEWEEYALFAGHYFLLVASTSNRAVSLETDRAVPSARPVDEPRKVHLTLTHHDQSQVELRRFGAAVALDGDTVAFHGGQGIQTRLASVDVLARDAAEKRLQPCKSTPPQARICHTVTPLDDTCALLVGGRASPSQALADCWLISQGNWTRVGDLPSARFRHSCVNVTLPSQESDGPDFEAVLIFGGRNSDGTVLDECLLWTRENGWNAIPVDGPRPSARFGAALSAMDQAQSWGVMCGGMAPSGVVLQDLWEWHITAAPYPQLKFFDRTSHLRYKMGITAFGRVGASLIPLGDHLLLIGGVSKQGVSKLAEDLLVISRDCTGGDTTYNVEVPALDLPQPTWPLLVGTSAAAASGNEIILAGGGAVCFSMGSFWNTGHFSITLQGGKSPEPTSTGDPQQFSQPDGKRSTKKKGLRPALPSSTDIGRIRIDSSENFAEALAASKPVIIENLNIGPCKDLWTIDYLKEKLGAERQVVIHECSSDRMTFKDKNFSYVKKPLGDFLDGIAAGAQTYLRAVSSAQPNKLPTKLEDDFPSIAGDFTIPEVLDVIKNTLHSSPLRISGPVALWLHYDVLANVLCQVCGSKTLHLFPPADVKYLAYPPGGSSSNTDILTSKDTRLAHTHPHIAHLRPGDILFIPPMWSHTAVPEDGVSVAVNAFFRNLEAGYAAGKDVYGNRDLQAYENGRRDVERIAKAFRTVPDDMAKFYLDRLAMEIQERADAVGKSARGGE
ncbi:LCM-domain-containing protein [Karstenula rhodostoma CBS 690.94]|uniref:tRNA wybutosine-synthesizing protein 4 n=1 Tax=Karstenula rhodostoma CBS 690.94 TaxID=1392251 RepID=A0A9P4UIP1_9PLEO|nr:LCM-domain-containing protein [Karstenula rhodostoma CBS 690.94]